MDTSLNKSFSNAIQTYLEWMRFFALQFTPNVDLEQERCLTFFSSNRQARLCVGVGRMKEHKEYGAYFTTRATFQINRPDLDFWENFSKFPFEVIEENKDCLSTFELLSIIQKSISQFIHLLDSRKDIPSINLLIQFKVLPNSNRPAHFNNALVGESLLLNLIIPLGVQPNTVWSLSAELLDIDKNLNAEKINVQFNAFDAYSCQVGHAQKEVQACYSHFFLEVVQICEDFIDDSYRA